IHRSSIKGGRAISYRANREMDEFVEGVVDMLNVTLPQNKKCSCTQLHYFELGFKVTLILMCILLITNVITMGYLIRKPVIRAYKRIRQGFSEDSGADPLFADTSD
uniref:Uncharacterized protein n=1 Tax=Parascaris univalens TaxID=6257 RepID=A0A915B8T0_PARUN